jgi:hypothetical protein
MPFEMLLATAQRYAALREEIVRAVPLAWPALQRAALRLGEHAAEREFLTLSDDVFFLSRAEAMAPLQAHGATGNGPALAEVVALRRRTWEALRLLAPPLRLGRPPAFLGRGFRELEAPLA